MKELLKTKKKLKKAKIELEELQRELKKGSKEEDKRKKRKSKVCGERELCCGVGLSLWLQVSNPLDEELEFASREELIKKVKHLDAQCRATTQTKLQVSPGDHLFCCWTLT